MSAPIDIVPHSVRSLASNTLCGVDSWGGTYTTEGITKLCEALKGSAVTSLECAAAPQSARLCVSHPAPPLARSIGRNKLGDQGAIVLAAGLKETQITNLGCAALLSAFAFLSAPTDTRIRIHHSRSAPRSHSLDWNNIGVKGASALAAILAATQITKLRCAAPRSRLVSAP